MRKTIKINLSGLIFNLDEDAYQSLKDYLDAIALRFRGMEESDEIITDIEARIAEIFQSRVGDKKQVIVLDDVREVINILGKPEDFADAGTAAEEAGPDQQTYGKRTKRLYRDPDNTVLGGVAGGIAAYIGTEAWVVRLIFFLLLLGYGVVGIIYIILWIVVPKAVTASQKLEMRGERVTVSNIEKSVRGEYDQVKTNMKKNVHKVRDSREFKRTTSVVEEILRVFGKIILIILKVILFTIGIGLIIGGITALVAALGIAFVRAPVFPFEIFGIHLYSFKELPGLSIATGSAVLMSTALILTLAIPVIVLVYVGIKMIFQIRADDRVIGLMALVIWLLSLVTFVSVALFEGRNFTAYGEISSTSTLREFPSDKLYITLNDDFPGENVYQDWIFDSGSDFFVDPDHDVLYGKIGLDIEKSSGDDFEISIIRGSKGSTREDARDRAGNLMYHWEQTDSLLILDPGFAQERQLKWRMPEMEVIVFVPEDHSIHLDRNTRFFLENVSNVSMESDYNMAGKSWEMTPEGLRLEE